MNKIGIIGNGFVGNAINQFMKKKGLTVNVFDIQADKCFSTFREVLSSELIFVCVPTPTNIQTGETDTGALTNVISKIPKNHNSYIVLKSTALPGTTRKIFKKRPDLKLIFSPEFLTERTAVIDFEFPSRIVLGFECPKINYESEEIYKFFKKCFPSTYLMTTDWETAEFIKYFCNCFYASKISIMNEFFQIAKALDLNWDECVDGLTSSQWVNKEHTAVPGPDRDFGFGGKCFPKDILAFITFSKNNGINPVMLSSAWSKNVEVRTNKNWSRIEGAFTKGENNDD
jgi:UDPglucose 6-dehydrogenase